MTDLIIISLPTRKRIAGRIAKDGKNGFRDSCRVMGIDQHAQSASIQRIKGSIENAAKWFKRIDN